MDFDYIGKSEGQIMVINDNGRSVCYQWSSHDTRWIEVGDVVGSQPSNRQVHEGKVSYYCLSRFINFVVFVNCYVKFACRILLLQLLIKIQFCYCWLVKISLSFLMNPCQINTMVRRYIICSITNFYFVIEQTSIIICVKTI